METITTYRHGDVLIKTKDGFSIPPGAKLKAGKLLHKGNNNSHVINGSALIGEFEGRKYLRVKEKSKVAHVGGSSTHKTMPLDKGDYWLEVQTFYDHVSEEAKMVVD